MRSEQPPSPGPEQSLSFEEITEIWELKKIAAFVRMLNVAAKEVDRVSQ